MPVESPTVLSADTTSNSWLRNGICGSHKARPKTPKPGHQHIQDDDAERGQQHPLRQRATIHLHPLASGDERAQRQQTARRTSPS